MACSERLREPGEEEGKRCHPAAQLPAQTLAQMLTYAGAATARQALARSTYCVAARGKSRGLSQAALITTSHPVAAADRPHFYHGLVEEYQSFEWGSNQ